VSGSLSLSLPEGGRGRALAVALLVILAAALWLALISPLIGWYEARSAALAEQRQLLVHMTALANSLPGLRRAATQVTPSADGPASSALVPGDSDAIAAATLQGAVQDMASGASASLSSIEVLPALQKGAFRRIGLRIHFAGNWPAFIALLKQVDQSSLQLLVDDLQLHVVDDESNGGIANDNPAIDASFVILAYRASTGEGATAAPRSGQDSQSP
jgi:general secretion pathway protein M